MPLLRPRVCWNTTRKRKCNKYITFYQLNGLSVDKFSMYRSWKGSEDALLLEVTTLASIYKIMIYHNALSVASILYNWMTSCSNHDVNVVQSVSPWLTWLTVVICSSVLKSEVSSVVGGLMRQTDWLTRLTAGVAICYLVQSSAHIV